MQLFIEASLSPGPLHQLPPCCFLIACTGPLMGHRTHRSSSLFAASGTILPWTGFIMCRSLSEIHAKRKSKGCFCWIPLKSRGIGN